MKAAGGLLLIALVCASPAHADNKAVAREAYTEATRFYDLADYAHALEAFKRAYMNYEDAAFLYNIAQCHRLLGNKSEALTFYRNYLRKVPDARNRAEVEAIIVNLDAAIAEDKAARNRPPTGMIAPQGHTAPAGAVDGAAAATPAPKVEPAAPPPATTTAATAPSSNPLVVEAQPPPRRTPVYKKWWLWTVVGVVAAGAAAGVAIGVTQGKSTEASLNTVHVQ